MRDIRTPDDLLNDICTPDKHGRIWCADRHLVAMLYQGMVERPGYADEMRPSLAWNTIYDFGLLLDAGRSGWMTRCGRLLGATFAAHERLLGYLGLTADDVECVGWARIGGVRGHERAKCLFRLSREQRNAVEELGILVDDGDERLKPRYVGPVAPVCELLVALQTLAAARDKSRRY